jgi:hypothetical protein
MNPTIHDRHRKMKKPYGFLKSKRFEIKSIYHRKQRFTFVIISRQLFESHIASTL